MVGIVGNKYGQARHPTGLPVSLFGEEGHLSGDFGELSSVSAGIAFGWSS